MTLGHHCEHGSELQCGNNRTTSNCEHGSALPAETTKPTSNSFQDWTFKLGVSIFLIAAVYVGSENVVGSFGWKLPQVYNKNIFRLNIALSPCRCLLVLSKHNNVRSLLVLSVLSCHIQFLETYQKEKMHRSNNPRHCEGFHPRKRDLAFYVRSPWDGKICHSNYHTNNE